MPMPVPSRQALQTFSRICRSIDSSATTNSRLPPRRAICICTQSRSRPHFQAQASRPLSARRKTHPATSTRTFATTPRPHVQPSPSQDTDPQNNASPTLPDITNHYTLFPTTFPHGPPGPNPLIQTTSSDPSTPETTPFTVHLHTLRREFIHLQSQYHPDKFPTGSAAHQKSLALSSLINEAYKTLSDPLLRAQYLLKLRYEIDVTSEDNSEHMTDQETLMVVMEAQERIEEASKEEEIEEMKDKNQRRMLETEGKLGGALEDGDVHTAKEECVRLKYWRSIASGLEDWEPGKDVRLVH